MPIREKSIDCKLLATREMFYVSFTMCVNDRKNLFTDTHVVNIFTEILKNVADKFQCNIAAYCFMPDHLHIIVTGTQHEVNIIRFVKEYKQKTGFWMSKNKLGVSWQKSFFDHIIRKDEDLMAVIRYILDNPVRKGLVRDWRDYPFKGAIGCNLDDILSNLL